MHKERGWELCRQVSPLCSAPGTGTLRSGTLSLFFQLQCSTNVLAVYVDMMLHWDVCLTPRLLVEKCRILLDAALRPRSSRLISASLLFLLMAPQHSAATNHSCFGLCACKLQRPRAMAGSGLDLGETFLSSAPTTRLGSSSGEIWGGPQNFPRGLCDSSGEVSSRQELSGDLLSMQMRGALFSLLLKCKSAAESNFLILHLQLIIMQPHSGFSLFLPFLLAQDTGVITPGEDRRQAFVKAGCQCPG